MHTGLEVGPQGGAPTVAATPRANAPWCERPHTVIAPAPCPGQQTHSTGPPARLYVVHSSVAGTHHMHLLGRRSEHATT